MANYKQMGAILLAAISVAANAQLENAQLGSERSTIYNYYSVTKESPAWQKDIITADGPDYTRLMDRQGVLADKQRILALEVAVSNLTEVAKGFNEGFQTGIENLVEATNNIPKHGYTFGLVMPLAPSETRTAIEGFIVDQQYDSVHNIDKLSIHFTQDLKVQPRIVCPYVLDGGMTTNLITGSFKSRHYPGSTWTNKFTIARGEITYDNCHLLFLERPAALQGFTTWFDSMVKWGTPQGIEYGAIVHTAFGEELFNGTLTNFNNHTYVTIKDGAIMGDGFIPFPAITNISGSGYVEGDLTGLTLNGNPGGTYLFKGDNLSGFTEIKVVYEDGAEGEAPSATEIVLPLSYENGVLSATMITWEPQHTAYYLVMTSPIGSYTIPVVFQFP